MELSAQANLHFKTKPQKKLRRGSNGQTFSQNSHKRGKNGPTLGCPDFDMEYICCDQQAPFRSLKSSQWSFVSDLISVKTVHDQDYFFPFLASSVPLMSLSSWKPQKKYF